uniref:Secreted protein n=1 Tax=Solanum tuberosum TaxID=4113 RepID=M1DAL7_SOLTU
MFSIIELLVVLYIFISVLGTGARTTEAIDGSCVRPRSTGGVRRWAPNVYGLCPTHGRQGRSVVGTTDRRKVIRRDKSSSPSGSAIRPLLSSITVMHWFSASPSPVTLGDPFCHRGTDRRYADYPFLSPTWFLPSGLAHWNFRQAEEPLDESPSGLGDQQDRLSSLLQLVMLIFAC